MKIAIDLTWLKPQKSGGVESYLRNLLDGFLKLPDQNTYILFAAQDNQDSLKSYTSSPKIKLIVCNTYATKVKSHLIWQNLFAYHLFKKEKVDLVFFPVYEMPLYKCKKLKTVVTIHDIQALHYPEYFSKLENIWFKLGWKSCLRNANKVVTISDFTKEDIKAHFKNTQNLTRIYNPIVLNDEEKTSFTTFQKEYNIEKDSYYYTLCSLHKHKNLITLIKVMEILKDMDTSLPKKLVISGVGGPQKQELLNLITEKQLQNNIILTNFVTNSQRNVLIKNANTFLFPSIFEGFGMPPIEAMMLKAKVITTKCTSLYEVTEGKCSYVDNPTDPQEWIRKIQSVQSLPHHKFTFPKYAKELIAREYLNLFYEVIKK